MVQTVTRMTFYVAAALTMMTIASNQAVAKCIVERWTTASRSRPVFVCPKHVHPYRQRRGHVRGAVERPATPFLAEWPSHPIPAHYSKQVIMAAGP